MGKVTIVSVTYENVVIEIKIVLPIVKCFSPPVWSLSRFMAILLVLVEPVCSQYICNY